MTVEPKGLGGVGDVLVCEGPKVRTRDGRPVRVDSDGRVWVLDEEQAEELPPELRRDAVKREG